MINGKTYTFLRGYNHSSLNGWFWIAVAGRTRLKSDDLAVAKSVVERQARAEGKSEVEVATEVVEIENRLAFGRVQAPKKRRRTRRRQMPENQLSLFDLAA